MIEQLIAEATECDFKVALEIKKPKSWLKSVSAFSNGIGGTLFFGISDDRKPIGLSDVQKDAEAISRLIKERITPLPQFILKPLQEDGKNLLALEVSPGRSTPYYYKADGVMEAYIRVGNESVIAPDYIVNELILKGTNQSFDTLTTDAVKKDYSFTLLEATYLERTGLRFEPSDYVSFGLADKNGVLTNMLRIDCWEAEKDLKTTPGSDCALTSLAVDEPLEYARLYLEGNLQMWVDAENSLEL